MSEAQLIARLRDRVQQDVGGRGLARDPEANLFTACAGDLYAACWSLVAIAQPVVGVVTGFYIPTADPPAFETDGPLGAVFLARALVPLGIRVHLFADPGCLPALRAGLAAAGRADVQVMATPTAVPSLMPALSHLVALECPGPNHTEASIRSSPGATTATVEAFREEVPPERRGRCHSMRGRDITEQTGPAHALFEPQPLGRRHMTVGIGDGGNEVGMGKVPWEVVRRNVPQGGLIACRVPADYLLVAGVSNWGAYALAAGTALLRRASLAGASGSLPADLFDPAREAEVLAAMVEAGPLVDGVTGRQALSVDGLPFDEYVKPLLDLGRMVEEGR